jgi:hypothetical protein
LATVNPQVNSPLLRASLESRFGHDFSQVRIHDDAIAGQSAREAYASAYTVGNHVVFAPGAYHPSSSEGRQLLAHELTHVVQHRHHPDVSVLSRSPGPGELYPSGHMIITCDDYKYGLTQSSFSISYSLSDADRRHTERSTSLLGSPTQFAECWYSHVRVHIRQRQTIYLPNDLATATSIGGSPCLDASETPAQANARTLIHERIHEADNPQRPPNHRFNTGYPFRSNGIQLIPCTGIQ